MSKDKPKAVEAIEFLLSHNAKAKSPFTLGSQSLSLLQLEGIDFTGLLEKFDPSDDENNWCDEYEKGAYSPDLIRYRKRMAFLKASIKDFHEEYDENVTDVDFIRLTEVPFTDPEYVLRLSIEELGDK